MPIHILYLVPVPGSRATETALLMKRNRASVAHIAFDDQAIEDSGCACVRVAIKDHVTSEWTFKVGNNEQCDFFLSFPGVYNVELVFYYGGHPDHISLMMRNNSSISARIMDPMNTAEAESNKMDIIPQTTRFLQRPTELIIGAYHFLVRRPPARTETAVAALEVRKRQVLHLTPKEEPENDWRPTNLVLGKRAFGEVTCLRGMRTGFTLARKRITGRRSQEQKMRNEVKILKSLSHKNIAECLGCEEAVVNNRFQLDIVTPIYASDLDRLMTQYPGASVHMFQILFPQIMDGVAYIHDKDIIHRDLKPGNIMLRSFRPPYSAVITDFGLSKTLIEDCNTKCGTLEYLAPEVASKSAVTEKAWYGLPADIFSCGVIAIEMLKAAAFSEARGNGIDDMRPVLAFHRVLRKACEEITKPAFPSLLV